MALSGQISPMVEQGQLGSGIQPPSMTERLRSRRDMLRAQLEDVEAALEALEGNEEVARVVDAISKLGHFLS